MLTLALPLLPGLIWTLNRLRGKERTLPDALTLSPAARSDLEQLAELPVKADWEALLNQPKRTILCLRAETELVGFATGFVNEQNAATLDGVFVVSEWRRQYWGSTLMDALREHFENEGVTDVRAVLFTNEKKRATFLHNLFFRPRAQILTPEEFPHFSPTIRKGWQNLREGFKKNVEDAELEIPRDIP